MERIEAAAERDEALFAKQQVVRLQALLEAGRRIHSTIARTSPDGFSVIEAHI